MTAAMPAQTDPSAPARLYLPVTDDDLAALARGEDLPGPRTAFAVTAAVRAAYPDDEEEDLEYAALWVAAGEDVSARRVVVALDVPGARVGPPTADAVAELARRAGDGDAATGTETADTADTHETDETDDGGSAYLVGVTGAIRRRDVVAVHVGEAGAAPEEELDWYDASELGVLAGG